MSLTSSLGPHLLISTPGSSSIGSKPGCHLLPTMSHWHQMKSHLLEILLSQLQDKWPLVKSPNTVTHLPSSKQLCKNYTYHSTSWDFRTNPRSQLKLYRCCPLQHI